MPPRLQFNVLTGPTAAGKTAWLLARAEQRQLTVVIADSRQVYRGLDIGTGKPTPAQQEKLPHLGLDSKDLSEDFSVFQYLLELASYLRQLRRFEGEVWIAGGTGLYIRSALQGLSFGAMPLRSVRNELLRSIRLFGSASLASKLNLQLADPANPVRVLRQVEAMLAVPGVAARLEQLLGLPDSSLSLPADSLQQEAKTAQALKAAQAELAAWEVGKVAVLDPGVAELEELIKQRVRAMFHSGLLDEVQSLMDRGFADHPFVARGIAYQEALAVLRGDMALEEAIGQAVTRTRQYAKRQRTYFRSMGWPSYRLEQLPFA